MADQIFPVTAPASEEPAPLPPPKWKTAPEVGASQGSLQAGKVAVCLSSH